MPEEERTESQLQDILERVRQRYIFHTNAG